MSIIAALAPQRDRGQSPMKSRVLVLTALVLIFLDFNPAAGFCQSRSQSEPAGMIQNLSVSLADLALRVRPSVVQIRTIGFEIVKPGITGFVASQHGTGSGVILDGDGFIVTNAHVVKGARHIEVWLNEALPQNGSLSEFSQKRSAVAHLIGMDQNTDLAVLKIDRTGLTPLSLADSDSLRQGQIVLAFGNPMALENSASMGVISSAERHLSSGDPAVYIQTDAPINPGNSGGPLVDAQGRLAGINTFIFSQSGGSEGIGFAIPAYVVKRIYTELRKEGHVHHGHIGIRVLAVTPSLAAGLQLPRDWGVILEDVEPGGPSDQANLHPGDYLLAVDGKDIKDLHQLLTAIDRHAIGDVLQISALRGQDKIEAKVTIQAHDDDPNRFQEMVSESSNLIPGLDILAVDVNENLLKMVSELRKPAGVLVAALVTGSQELEDGFAPGDLIISLNGKSVFNIETLRKLLAELQVGSPIVMQIQREDQLRFVVLDLP